MMGEIGILNVGAGDTKLVFDPSKPEEVERSARIVTDMIRRGFVLLIEVGSNDKGPIYQRVKDFDPHTSEYIVAGTISDQEEQKHDKKPTAPPRRRKEKAGNARRIPAAAARGIAVAPTAGG